MRFNYRIFSAIGVMVPGDDNTAVKNIESKNRLDWDDDFNNIEEIQNLKPGDVVVDAGAWIGDTTKTFLKKGCIVHAFEAREDNFICLLNNCPEANCYNIALGDGRKYGTDKRGGNTGGYPLTTGNKLSIPLDAFLITKLDFLKIDVEGWERFVLAGSYNTLRDNHPVIHIEINPFALRMFDTAPDQIMQILDYHNYKNFKEVYRYHGEFGDHWDIIAK